MAKKIVGYIKLQIPAGKANPSPPVGPALGQRGLNIMAFVKEFNAVTQGMEPGMPVPVVITAFGDRTFTFVMKTPPNTLLSYEGGQDPEGQPDRRQRPPRSARSLRRQLREIAAQKMVDMKRQLDRRQPLACSPVPPARWASPWWRADHGTR